MEGEPRRAEDNLIVQLWNRYFPYWPLFVALLIIFFSVAWTYIRYTTPLYMANASILIKDEKKGMDDSKIIESLNYLSTKKIVENEIEVLHSKSLMRDVVKDFRLYASVYEDGWTKPRLVYGTSPVRIEFQNVDTLTRALKVAFSFDDKEKKVIINNKSYATGMWVRTDVGLMKFSENKTSRKFSHLFFRVLNPKIVVDNFIANLNVSPVSKLSTVVNLSFQDESPQRAEDVLNGVLGNYSKISTDEKNSLATNTLAFVEDRLSHVKHDLDSIEQKIQKFKSDKGAFDISSQGRLFLENVSSNDQKLADVDMQLAILKQVQNYTVSNNNNTTGIVPSTLGVSDPLLNQLLNKLYDAQLQYEKLKTTTGENNPILLSVTNEIQRIKPSILANIEGQRRSLEVSKHNLFATNGAYTNVIQAIPQKERELVEISREQSIKTNIYNFLLQKREETAFSFSSNTLNNRIIDQADASMSPISPNSKKIYLVSLVLALALGISLVSGKELLTRKVLYRHHIEELTRLPIIGEIAYEKSKNPIAISQGKRSLVAEQFRELRTSLSYMDFSNNYKKILITSSMPGEGKSFIAANLGLSLAIMGKKVVLLEFDLNNPSLSEKLTVSSERGISCYLKGEVEADEIIKKTENSSNLFVISSGPILSNSSELITNGRLKDLLADLEEKFDHIIIDTAPVGALSDAYIIAPLCDAVLYIVRHMHTPRIFVQRLSENKKLNVNKNVAIVFNSIRTRGFVKDYYGYGYGYGYGYNPKQPKKKWLGF